MFLFCKNVLTPSPLPPALFLYLLIVIETVGSGHHPLAGYQRTPADVSTSHMQADLPWPLPLHGIGAAHNAAGELPQTTV